VRVRVIPQEIESAMSKAGTTTIQFHGGMSYVKRSRHRCF